MVLVLDANEYIFAFGSKEKISRKLLDKVLDKDIPVRIPRTIFEEVRRHLSPETFREFALFINKLTTIADILVTENRHFLSRSKNLAFKVLTAKDCLKILKK